MKFKYEKLLAGKGASFDKLISIPLIRVGFPSFSVDYPCLVDSGAEDTIFHGEIGRKAFGLKIENGKERPIRGITGSEFKGYIHKIKYILGGWDYEAEVVFTDGLVYPFGILGRKGFFEFFVVKITHNKESIELKDLTR